MKQDTPEYSDDLMFFMKEQVFAAITQGRTIVSINSRLESRNFAKMTLPGYLTEDEFDRAIQKKCAEIHRELILNGEAISLTV